MKKNITIFIVIPLLVILILSASHFSPHRIAVEKYLKKNYKNEKLIIRYDGSKKCLIKRKCVKRWDGMDFDGSRICTKTKNYYKPNCQKYHYVISSKNEFFTLDVVRENGKYRVESNSTKKNKDTE